MTNVIPEIAIIKPILKQIKTLQLTYVKVLSNKLL